MKERMKILIGYDGSEYADAAIDDLRLAGAPRRKRSGEGREASDRQRVVRRSRARSLLGRNRPRRINLTD